MAYVYSPCDRYSQGNASFIHLLVAFLCKYPLLAVHSVGKYTSSFAVEIPVTKDNPAFSMINDSDEEVLFGDASDVDESKRPLTLSLSNDYDSD